MTYRKCEKCGGGRFSGWSYIKTAYGCEKLVAVCYECGYRVSRPCEDARRSLRGPTSGGE